MDDDGMSVISEQHDSNSQGNSINIKNGGITNMSKIDKDEILESYIDEEESRDE